MIINLNFGYKSNIVDLLAEFHVFIYIIYILIEKHTCNFSLLVLST